MAANVGTQGSAGYPSEGGAIDGMRPVHPGEVLLEDYIKPMGIGVRALSPALHVPYSRLREIVDGKRGI
jgi:plasmid maintenance system antidote protein VapI